MRRRALVLLAALSAVWVLPAGAHARGGHYVLSGGSRAEQTTVRAALDVSSFDWDLVRSQVVIHIVKGAQTSAVPGEISLDSDLLDAGVFSWGIVQHEYGHQVDFFVLDDELRARLGRVLGARDWCYKNPGFSHADYGCERFASSLAWAYWPDRRNVLRPTSPADEAGAIPPARFRALMHELIGAPATLKVPAAGASSKQRRCGARSSRRRCTSRATGRP